MEEHQTTSSFDEMVAALADIQRRKLLVALLEHTSQDDATVIVGGSERDADHVDSLVQMQHVHLPRLADYGFIKWNKDTYEVKRGPRFDEIRPLLELLVDHEDELPADWL